MNCKVDSLSFNGYTTTKKNKLEGIKTGSNKTTVVDAALNRASTNPVQKTDAGDAIQCVLGKSTDIFGNIPNFM